jgi:hypothetical protein
MKLIFSKNTDNEIDLKLQKGTVAEDFTYIEMVKQLLQKNEFEDTDFGSLSQDEQDKIKNMLTKISAVFEEEKEEDAETETDD